MILHRGLPFALVFGLAGTSMAGADGEWKAQREALAQEVERQVRRTSYHTGRDALAPAVLRALRTVPRHEFVPAEFLDQAYDDHPLPIGEGQTISQPYIVALMTDLAEVGAGSKVLEIGTGSGYQAAVLAEFVGEVYTIEIVEPLGLRAKETLERLGYDNVHVRVGDGYAGWPEAAPFDAIIVTAAPEAVPQPLVDQLAVGGRLVVPVGPQFSVQSLQVLEKSAGGDVDTRHVLPVQFVPFTREENPDAG